MTNELLKDVREAIEIQEKNTELIFKISGKRHKVGDTNLKALRFMEKILGDAHEDYDNDNPFLLEYVERILKEIEDENN